jgi:PKD repeat protein
VKTKNEDMSIRELFRQKLGNTGIAPDPSLGSKLMRKQARREFIRFNPVRFNIYYLGGILVASITAGIILSPLPKKQSQLASLNQSSSVSNIVSSENKQNSGRQSEPQKLNSTSQSTSESTQKRPVLQPREPSLNETPERREMDVRKNIEYTGISDTISKMRLLNGQSVEMNKLKGGFKSVDASFEISSKEGCAPLHINFYSKAGSQDSCRWIFGDGGNSVVRNPDWIFDVEGEYKVILTVFGSDGSQATSSAVITVFPKPLARFEIAPDKPVLPKDEIRFFNYSTNAIHFKWDFGDGNRSELFEPRHKYDKYSNYNVSLKVSSDLGCSDSMIVMNAFSGSEYFIDFPNAFLASNQGPTGGFYSAKSDESSQVFHPVFTGVTDYQLRIYSKIGVVVFETTDINIGWDGYFKGQLCDPGVYIWKVRGSFRNGEPIIKMGNVTLLRN